MGSLKRLFLLLLVISAFLITKSSSSLLVQQEAFAVRNKSQSRNPVECLEVRKFNASFQCKFVQDTADCRSSDGFVQYNHVIYCHFASHHIAAFILLAFWLVYLFIALGVTAEEFFCPCLKTFARSLRMSDSVAGVTLLALGNGAPDIFSVLVAITAGDKDAAPLAFQELFGSGMFVTTVVVGSIQLRNAFRLARRPFIRDVVFYISAVTWTFVVMYRKDIQTAEAVGFIVLYVIYVTLVIAGQAVNRTIKTSKLQGTDTYQGSVSDGDIQSPPRYASRAVIEDLHASADFTEFEPNDRSLLIKNHHSNIANYVSSINENEHGDTDQDSAASESYSKENFLERISGISVEDWKSKRWFWKVFDLIKVPLVILLNLTNPVIDVDADGLKWNKWLVILQCFASPVACAFITKKAFLVVYKTFVVWELVLSIGAVLAVIVLLSTNRRRPPKFHTVFAIAGFVASVIWIYALAQEVVNLLMAFGISFGLTNAVLGLTLLAWGNSIGDFISNLAMAKNGAPRMAIAACYGGPLLNMMLGVGISCTLSSLTHNGDVKLIRGHTQYIISAAFLAVSLVSALVLLPLLKFNTSKIAGLFLIVLYVGYLSISIVNELNLIPKIQR